MQGDVLGVAKIAGIQAAKKTADLIPLCHSLSLRKVDMDHVLDEPTASIELACTCVTLGQTGTSRLSSTDRVLNPHMYIYYAGVEMEALTGVSVAALTIYDMIKAVAPEAIISDIRLERKLGGKTGSWLRKSLSIED